MMQKSKSSKTQFLKPLMVLPVLALFLMAFNRETIYTYEESPNQLVEFTDDKQFEFLIDKSTTDAELDKLKTQLAKDDIDFSYTVVRNDEKEIIGLSLQVNGKNSEGKSFSGSFSTEEDTPIKPLILKIDDAGNSISFGNADFLSETEEIHFRKGHVVVHSGDEGDDEIHEIVIKGVGKDKGPMKWRFDSDSDAKTVDIRETDGKRTIIVDGKEISEGEWEVMEEADKGKMHKIRIGKIVKDKDKNVIIIKDSDDDEDIEVIETDGSGFFFVDNDEGEEPLYYVNGKKVTKKKFKELKPSQIESIEVRKGEKAIEKYGKKAVNGVIEVITKE